MFTYFTSIDTNNHYLGVRTQLVSSSPYSQNNDSCYVFKSFILVLQGRLEVSEITSEKVHGRYTITWLMKKDLKWRYLTLIIIMVGVFYWHSNLLYYLHFTNHDMDVTSFVTSLVVTILPTIIPPQVSVTSL